MLKTVRDINTKNQREFKSYLKRTLSGVKMGESSRKGYHIRFALDPSQFDTYFKKYNLIINYIYNQLRRTFFSIRFVIIYLLDVIFNTLYTLLVFNL